MEVREIEWTTTGINEIESWMLLNRRMDRGDRRELMALSLCWRAIARMDCVTNDYLLYMIIDSKNIDTSCEAWYEKLGREIRTVGMRYPYATISLTNYTHANFNLRLDVAYGVTGVDPSAYSDRIRQLILADINLNTLTGITHSAWCDWCNSKSADRFQQKTKGEVEWEYINWKDVISMVPTATHAPVAIRSSLKYLFGDRGIDEESKQKVTDSVIETLLSHNRQPQIDSGYIIRYVLAGVTPPTHDLSSSQPLDIKLPFRSGKDVTPSFRRLISRLSQWNREVGGIYWHALLTALIVPSSDPLASYINHVLRSNVGKSLDYVKGWKVVASHLGLDLIRGLNVSYRSLLPTNITPTQERYLSRIMQAADEAVKE